MSSQPDTSRITTPPGPPIESIDRALVILSALAQAGPRGIALADLSVLTNLNKATVHRALASLKYRGFASQDIVSGRYALGSMAAQLGEIYYGHDNLAVLLRPTLSALCAEVGELVHLGVLEGNHMVYLSKVEPERAVRVFSQVGSRVPAFSTAMGRAVFAAMDIDASQAKMAVPDEIPDKEQVAAHLIREIDGARTRGFAREREENEPGITCVALPVFRGKSAIAAVSITAPSQRMTEDRMEELARVMKRVLDSDLPAPLHLGDFS